MYLTVKVGLSVLSNRFGIHPAKGRNEDIAMGALDLASFAGQYINGFQTRKLRPTRQLGFCQQEILRVWRPPGFIILNSPQIPAQRRVGRVNQNNSMVVKNSGDPPPIR